jgi:hypothetical protein
MVNIKIQNLTKILVNSFEDMWESGYPKAINTNIVSQEKLDKVKE